MTIFSQSLSARRTTVTFAGTTDKKAAIPFTVAPGAHVVHQVRVVPLSLDGADQTYNTWIAMKATALPGDADTVFFDEDRAIVTGSTHTVAEQVFKAIGESDFFVIATPNITTLYVFVELDALDAASFEVEIITSHMGVHTQYAKRVPVEVT